MSAGGCPSLARRSSRPSSLQTWLLGHCLRNTDARLWNILPASRAQGPAPVSTRLQAPARLTAAATSAGSPQAPPLTPRQRRLAQQRRKWEETQRQQPQQPQQQQPPQPPKPKRSPQPGSPDKNAPLPQQAAETSAGVAPGAGPSSTPGNDPQVGTRRASAGAVAVAAAASSSRCSSSATLPGVSAPRHDGASASPGPLNGVHAGAADVAPGLPPKAPSQQHHQLQSQQQSQHQSLHQSQDRQQQRNQEADGVWPSLFADRAGTSLSPALDDLNALSGQELLSVASQWTEELVRWEAATGSPTSTATSSSSTSTASPSISSASSSSTSTASSSTSTASSSSSTSSTFSSIRGYGAHGGSVASGDGGVLAKLPAGAAERLARLTSAVDAQVTRGSLGHQELADLAWCVAHYDRDYSLRVLHPALGVPFSVVPQFMPGLRLEDFMSQVELRRETIYLDDGSRAVEESRLTGWQSEIGATFKYSGKEMQPQLGGLSPHVLRVRDALWALTGVKYDSVLINYYGDGKCGMRYHVDPLYDRWTPNSAVVSLGDTRTFIFRAISDHNTRWQYRVRNGDVVLMFGDCQERLQHCVRVEKRAEDAGPRMSLVFKERLRGPTGHYLLP